MAVNKNAVIRYRALDRCFNNRMVKYDIWKLIEAVNIALSELDENSKGISRAQVYEDIAFMKSLSGYNIDLDENYKDGRTRYYRYADPNFSINNLPLNEVEVNQLRSAVDILTQFKGMPQFEWIQELIPKLKQGISTEQNIDVIIDFDSNKYLRGIEHIGTLYNAIYYKKALSISYQPFENETAYDITLHPYFLKQYNNRWFLFGFNPDNEKSNWNLALDRIQSIKEIKSRYRKNTEVDWSDYFEDIIGVTKEEGKQVENITLHFIGKTGKYIESKPIHGSQKSKWIDNKLLEVNLQLIVNYEFESLVLSYADNVKIVSPKWFVGYIKNKLGKAERLY